MKAQPVTEDTMIKKVDNHHDKRQANDKLFTACAGFSGSSTDARAALDAGAYPDAQTQSLDTALHWVAANGHTAIARLLIETAVERGIEQSAYVNAINEDLQTPMHNAATNGRVQIVRLLIDSGADLSLKDYQHKTARDLAAEKGRADVVRWLDAATEERKDHAAQVEKRRRPVGPCSTNQRN
jgi:ankyrin repeat protein